MLVRFLIPKRFDMSHKETPDILPSIFTYGVVGLSFFFIVKFFINFNIIFLLSGTIVPLIAFTTSSQYFGGFIFATLLLIGSSFFTYYLNSPYNYLVGAFVAYYIMFKIIRYGFDLTGDYLSDNNFTKKF